MVFTFSIFGLLIQILPNWVYHQYLYLVFCSFVCFDSDFFVVAIYVYIPQGLCHWITIRIVQNVCNYVLCG